MLSVALAGKPNAGKSTVYAAATDTEVDVANYPFTTIDANRGVAYARTDCPCLDREERCGDEHCRAGKRYVPVELYDVAGLVPGAHEGRGLGNQFLDELTNADVILNVGAAGGVHDVDDGVGVGQLVQKLVAQSAALVGTGDESGHVEEFDGDVSLALVAVLVAASLLAFETGAVGPGVTDAPVRVDGREGVVGHVHVGHRGGLVKGGLARVGLARQRDGNHARGYRRLGELLFDSTSRERVRFREESCREPPPERRRRWSTKPPLVPPWGCFGACWWTLVVRQVARGTSERSERGGWGGVRPPVAVRLTPRLKPEASVSPSSTLDSHTTIRYASTRVGHKTLLESRRTPFAMTAIKIIKVLGTSEEGWEQAAQEAVDQASRTIDDIHGVEVEDWTADVENGQIQEYKSTVEVAFPVHDEE